MHCPQCGQQQVSDETRFCSRCGFLLTGVAEVVANQGLVPAQRSGLTGNTDSPRRRGIKQGVFLFLLVFLLGPLVAMVSRVLGMNPSVAGIVAVLCVMGGLLRTIYALMFESGATVATMRPALPLTENRAALPPPQSIPASAYTSPAAGSWRDTNDLQHQPGSVTDSTTKLLHKEDQ